MMLNQLLLLPLISAQAISANYKTFKKEVLESPHVVLVEFFAPWCGHCQALDPEFKKAASKLRGMAKLVQVDCDNSINRDLCGRFEVKGYPTLKIFGAGVKGIPSDYNGERTAKGIVDAIIPMIPSKHVIKVVDGKSGKKTLTLSDFKKKEDGKLAKVLLATDKKSTPNLIKGLSIEYLDRLVFGVVSKKEVGVIEELNIQSFPTVIVFPLDGEPVVYDGKIKQKSLVEFFDQYALPPKETKAKPKTKSEKSKTKPAKEKIETAPFDPKVEELTCENCLQTKCLAKEICVVAFLTQEKEYAESLEQFNQHISLLQAVKKKLHARKKSIDFVWTNAITHGSQLIKDFGVSDVFPSLMVIDPKKQQYSLLRTAFDEASLTSWLDIFLSGGGRTPYSKTPYLDKPTDAKEVPKETKKDKSNDDTKKDSSEKEDKKSSAKIVGNDGKKSKSKKEETGSDHDEL